MKNKKFIIAVFLIIIIAVISFLLISISPKNSQRIDGIINLLETFQTYKNEGIGIAFTYPQIFGEVLIKVDPRPTESGHWFLGTFTQNDKFILGGITNDFQAGRSGMLTDTRGFFEEDGKYYFKFVAEKLDYRYELQPFKVLDKDFGKILILNDKSFKAERNDIEGPILGVGQGNYAALLNLKGEIYPGIIIWNQNLNIFSLEDFEKVIDSIAVFKPDKPKSELIYLPENLSNIKTLNNLQPPLNKAGERVTKKKFGDYITLQNSPIQPERFNGFHTGVDFEIFSKELNTEVSVSAICSGKIKLKQYVRGYGGMAVQVCELNKEPITVIYGHLKLSSIPVNLDENIEAGERIGILGADKSYETDYERKHLHLAIYKGIEPNIKGYIDSQSELVNWIDPCFYICHN